ncbi:MAG TPA: hypothetical protein VJS69_12795, partial [Candidatus Krumholzibacteria bacterium]|nr:hypothetical protein [Candidatus Krumholzibacteria bacterium]
MKTSRWALGLALGLFAVSCGGGGGGPAGPGGGGGGGGGGSNSFTGTIDGASWKSDAALIQITAANNAARQGELVISGYSTSAKRGITLNISFFSGPATQPLGVNPITNPGGTGTVLITPNLWMTPMSGQAGFVTLTARTDKRIAGTFHFGADALVGGTVPASR